MALAVVGWRLAFLGELWLAGDAGVSVENHTHFQIFVEHLIAEEFDDKTRILIQRYRLTQWGRNYADMLFVRKQ